MPFVRPHTRGGTQVKGHHRVQSRLRVWIGLILLTLLFTYFHRQGIGPR